MSRLEMWAGFHAPEATVDPATAELSALLSRCGVLPGVHMRSTSDVALTRGALTAPATHLLQVVFEERSALDRYLAHPGVTAFNEQMARLEIERLAMLGNF